MPPWWYCLCLSTIGEGIKNSVNVVHAWKAWNGFQIIFTDKNNKVSWNPRICQNSFCIFLSIFKQFIWQVVQRSKPLTTPPIESMVNKKNTFSRNLLMSFTAWYCHIVSFTFPINSPFGPKYAIIKTNTYKSGTTESTLSAKTSPRTASCAKEKIN